MSFPLSKAHPWHGVSAGVDAPNLVNAYIEIVPTDTVKYEIDKATGHLRVDRPQRYSNQCPTLYGFIPQTYCGKGVGQLCCSATKRTGIDGDGDPLDICVLTERSIPHGDILLEAVPIGGFRMIDAALADDKVLAVLKDDPVYGAWRSIEQCPDAVVTRLRHYFLTYKDMPGDAGKKVEIPEVYGAAEARKVIQESQSDYSRLLEQNASSSR